MKHYIILLLLFSYLTGLSQKEYSLSGESTLEIEGTSTINDWTVVAHTLEGSLETNDGRPTAVNLEVEVADIKSTRGAVMDKKTHNALKIDTNPTITFSMEKVNEAAVMNGVLRMAGKTKTIEVATKIIDTGTTIKISGQYPITLQDWDIAPPSAMFGQIVVGDEVTVKFDLVFSN